MATTASLCQDFRISFQKALYRTLIESIIQNFAKFLDMMRTNAAL